jgi:hypothetical protein
MRSLWRRRSDARLACQRCCLLRRGVNATGRAIRVAPVARASHSRNGRFVFEFELRGGFGQSVERVLPGPLYTQKRDRLRFFILLLASYFGFRNLREQPEKENHVPCPLRHHPLRLAMADRVTVVPPRDPWPFSIVTVDDLEALVADGLLRPLSGDPQPEWMVPPSGADPTPLPGYVLSFVSFHERGFGVPASHFMRALLHYYRVELHNFNPNSIAQAAIFVAVCEGFFWGLTPTRICGPISSPRSFLP